MSKNHVGPSDVVTGVVAVGALLVCCGGPLLIAGLVALVASTGLIAKGAVLAGLGALGLGAVLGIRYAMRRSAAGPAERSCGECGARSGGPHPHGRRSAPPAA